MRQVCAVYVELSEDRLYHRKHNGIAQCYFEHVSQLYGKAKSISVLKSTPTPLTDAGVVSFSGVQYIISVRECGGNMLGSAHAFMTYEM
jgi:hypothetical protein